MEGVCATVGGNLPIVGQAGGSGLTSADIAAFELVIEETDNRQGRTVIGKQWMNGLNVGDFGVDEGSTRGRGLRVAQLVFELSNELLAGECSDGLRHCCGGCVLSEDRAGNDKSCAGD